MAYERELASVPRPKDLKAHTLQADILFVACGVPGLIKGDMIKEGAVVVDIGINRVPDIDKDGNPVLNKKGKPKKKHPRFRA